MTEQPVPAPDRGDRTIRITITLHTDAITDKGMILPRHCWDSGWAYVKANKAHGIHGTKEVKIKLQPGLDDQIRQALADAGVTLHHDLN